MSLFVITAMWVGGLFGAFTTALIASKTQQPTQDHVEYYRIGIDYAGNTRSICKEGGDK